MGDGVLSTGPRTRGLECKLGHGRIVLPADEIDLLGEYPVGARLPVSERIDCAIGVWAGQPVLSVSLAPHEPAMSRMANGALLLVGSRGIRWALEIDQSGRARRDQLDRTRHHADAVATGSDAVRST